MSAHAPRATGPLRRILLATKDPLLRRTRHDVLVSFGYHVAVPSSEGEALTLIQSERFELLILGNTLDDSTKVHLATKYRDQQRHGRVIEIIASFGHPPSGDPDAAVVGLDGPPALQRAIEEQLRFATERSLPALLPESGNNNAGV